ncbi:MAG: hypothetical protein EZS28_017879, partial [Streblomastix strix]
SIEQSSKFEQCISESGNGGAIQSVISGGTFEISGAIFDKCNGINGGGIYSIIDAGGKLIMKDSCSFSECTSINGNGGGIYVNIDFSSESQILLQGSTFTLCQAFNSSDNDIHKGYGSGIFASCINWDNINNGIDLSGIKYITCSADQGDKGLFIIMNKLRQFCRFGSSDGQYVRSDEYIDNSSDKSLLMGYLGLPTTFESTSIDTDLLDRISALEPHWRNINKEWYISSTSDGKNNIACGIQDYPCSTIGYALTLDPSLYSQSEYNPLTDTATLILLQDDSKEQSINIISSTILGNNIAIQSLNGGEGKTLSTENIHEIDSKLLTSSLFIISGTNSKLGLYHLKFNNLEPTSTAPLIQLTGNSGQSDQGLLNIEGCLFKQSENETQTSLSHTLIMILGGIVSIKKVTISNYQFGTDKNIINIQSVSSTQECQLMIIETTISSIHQSGNDGGVCIKGTISIGSKISIEQSSKFEQCISESGNGGAIQSVISGGTFEISGAIFDQCICKSGKGGGGIYSEITGIGSLLQIEDQVEFIECESQGNIGSGGGLYSIIETSGNLSISQDCYFTDCKCTSGNGGGIYVEMKSLGVVYIQNDVYFSHCKAVQSNQSTPPTGLGGGIFLLIYDDIQVTEIDINLKGALYYENEGSNNGNSLFVVMNKLNEWCIIGNKGEYVKGNYSDEQSDEVDLEGIIENQSFLTLSNTQVNQSKLHLSRFWTNPDGNIWHVLFHESQSYGFGTGRDVENCGYYDDPCETIEFATQEISIRLQGSASSIVTVKKIGISSEGFELINPYDLNKNVLKCEQIQIMKELYQRKQEMDGQAAVTIKKNNLDSKENGQQGWIQAIDGMKYGLYGIDLITDKSTLNIPVIYISGSDSELELISMSLIGINMSPPLSAKGIVNINDDVKMMFIYQCLFQDIDIVGAGGNVIRIGGSSSTSTSMIDAIINDTTFKSINSKGDSNNRGGSAIFAQLGQGSILNIIGGSKFDSIKCTNGDGGAIYASLTETAQFIVDEGTSFTNCDSFAEANIGGRGGGIYLHLPDGSSNDFMIWMSTVFKLNKASKFGRDIFIYCKDIYKLNVIDKILIDVFSSEYNTDNALFGTEFASELELGHTQLVDYNLLSLLKPYFNDSLFISSKEWRSFDAQLCGIILVPCKTIDYAKTRMLTGEWNKDTIIGQGDGIQDLIHVLIIIEEFTVDKQYDFEYENLTLRGALQSEIDVGINMAQLKFQKEGQIIIADISRWRRVDEQSIGIGNKGPDQKILLQRIKFLLPEESQYGTLIGGGIYVGLIDQSSEEKFLSKKKIGDYLRNIGKQGEQLYREINSLSRPIITIDITVILKCKSSVISGSSQIKVLESGGALFHTEKVGSKCDLRSSIFSECSTTTVSGSTSTSSNFAPQIISGDEQIPFELLWEREIGIGIDGSGILIAYGGSEPTIKAQGTQFNNSQLLRLKNTTIQNASVEQVSVIYMSGCKNMKLDLLEGVVLQSIYTSSDGSAIHVVADDGCIINAEGVIFKQCQSDSILGGKGGAIYIDMKQFDAQVSFKRCIFVGNQADWGSNVFFVYSNISQRVGKTTFIGCTAIVPNNYEQQISVCYTIGTNNQVFIDERDLLHTSWQRQNNEGVVRFIGISDDEHFWNPDTVCGQITNPCDTYGAIVNYIQKEQEISDGSTGRVETLIYCEGKFISTFMDMNLTRSKTVNFVGFGREKTELGAKINFYNTMLQGMQDQNIVMEKLKLAMQPASPKVNLINLQGKKSSFVLQEVNVQGYIDSTPQNTMMEPEYFIQCEGFIILIDVIMEHIYMRTGSVMMIQNMRSFSGDKGMEMVSKIKPGFYESYKIMERCK